MSGGPIFRPGGPRRTDNHSTYRLVGRDRYGNEVETRIVRAKRARIERDDVRAENRGLNTEFGLRVR